MSAWEWCITEDWKKPAKGEQRAKRGDVDWSNAGNSDEDLEAAISAMRGK